MCEPNLPYIPHPVKHITNYDCCLLSTSPKQEHCSKVQLWVFDSSRSPDTSLKQEYTAQAMSPAIVASVLRDFSPLSPALLGACLEVGPSQSCGSLSSHALMQMPSESRSWVQEGVSVLGTLELPAELRPRARNFQYPNNRVFC